VIARATTLTRRPPTLSQSRIQASCLHAFHEIPNRCTFCAVK
jgi:hypothetical protein